MDGSLSIPLLQAAIWLRAGALWWCLWDVGADQQIKSTARVGVGTVGVYQT